MKLLYIGLLAVTSLTLSSPSQAQPTTTTETTVLSARISPLETTGTVGSPSAPPATPIPTTAPSQPPAPPLPTAAPPPPATDEPTSVTLPEGVVYQILREGSGPTATSTQTLLLHYTLYLTDGTKVESSRDAEFPVPLQLARGEGGFIKGFELGVAGMKVGDIRRIYVPAHLGYGEEGSGPVKPNTPLLFEVELVEAKNP